MSLCEKYPYTTAAEILDHLSGLHGGIYNVGFQVNDDVPWTEYITGSADLVKGFFGHESDDFTITYFAVWKEGTCE